MKLKRIMILIFGLLFLVSCVKKNSSNDTDEKIKDDRQFKAVWMSTFIGEAPYNSEIEFKQHMEEAFEIFEFYGINALIFHVRTHNNAFYKSEYNPLASWWSSVVFDDFDPLGWIIDEAHKRGIEFHAWMNPYRVNYDYQFGDVPLNNPQNEPSNLIIEGSSIILNPAKEIVREHIYSTILEFVELYPTVDAIHFDDYFYIQTDQPPLAAYERRQNIDNLIQGIDELLSFYNSENNLNIQFGISPTGIWRNGDGIVTYLKDGTPLTSGSSTLGFEHYGNYLYADTVKWATEGWIDYLIPQTYWARDLNVARYEPLIGWWDAVFKYLDVNLYSGIGTYMADESGNRAGWSNDKNEMDAQLKIVEELENVDGYCIFSYKHLKNGYYNENKFSGVQIKNAYNKDARKMIKVLPEIKSMNPINLPVIENINVNTNTLTWDSITGGKFYYIYRNEEKLTYSSDEIIGVIGHYNGLMSFDISGFNGGEFGVRVLSQTNHLSEIPNNNK